MSQRREQIRRHRVKAAELKGPFNWAQAVVLVRKRLTPVVTA